MYLPPQGQQDKGNSWPWVVWGDSEMPSAVLWSRGCPSRWNSSLADSMPLWVMLGFISLSPAQGCARGGRQWLDAAFSLWEFWEIMISAGIPCPVACAGFWKQHCGLKTFSSSGYLRCHVHEMVKAARPSTSTASALSSVYLPWVPSIGCDGLFTAPTLLEDSERQSRLGNPLCLANSHCSHKSLFPKQTLNECSATGAHHPLLPCQGRIKLPDFGQSTPVLYIYAIFYSYFTVSSYSQLL